MHFSDTAAFTAYTDTVMTPPSLPYTTATATTTATNTSRATAADDYDDDDDDGINDDINVTSTPTDVIVAPSNVVHNAVDNRVTWTPGTACR